MKALLLISALCLGLVPASPLLTPLVAKEKEKKEKDWRDKLDPFERSSGARWKPMPEGSAEYEFGWSGFTAAKARLDFSRGKKEGRGVERLDAVGETMGATRMLWRMDVEALFLTDFQQANPLRSRQVERYGDRSVVSVLEFSPKAAYYSKSRVEKSELPDDLLEDEALDREGMKKLTGKKGKRFKFPEMLSLHASLLYLRSQPLAEGDRHRFVVFHDTAAYYAEVKVGKRERLSVRAGEFAAIPFKVELEWVDKKQRLRKHKNFRSATGWFSDDDQRLLLKVESEVFVGSIWAELVRFIPAGEKSAALPEKP